MIKQAVILAAGRGSRLQHLAQERTKAMLPVLGKPMMVRVMDRILEAGITRFVVVIGESEGGLASYLSGSWYPHTEVKYVLQPAPTGTADALALASRYIEGDFLLAAVDNLPMPDHIPAMIQQFERSEADVVLSLINASPDEIQYSADVMLEDDRVTQIVEKPEQPEGNLSAFMIYACKKSFLNHLSRVKTSPRGERELASAIQMVINEGGKVSFVKAQKRFHLTHDEDLLTISQGYLDEGRDASILSDLPGSVMIIPPVRIDPGVSVGQHARIGPYVYLETGCTLGEGVTVSHSLVLRNATISKGEICTHQIVTRSKRIQVAE